MSAHILIPGAAQLAELRAIMSAAPDAVALPPTARAEVAVAAEAVSRAAQGDAPIYGVNTGFGKLASVRIAAEDTAKLQRNLILSHCCGVGDEAPPEIVRLTMALKLLSLGRGAWLNPCFQALRSASKAPRSLPAL